MHCTWFTQEPCWAKARRGIWEKCQRDDNHSPIHSSFIHSFIQPTNTAPPPYPTTTTPDVCCHAWEIFVTDFSPKDETKLNARLSLYLSLSRFACKPPLSPSPHLCTISEGWGVGATVIWWLRWLSLLGQLENPLKKQLCKGKEDLAWIVNGRSHVPGWMKSGRRFLCRGQCRGNLCWK